VTYIKIPRCRITPNDTTDSVRRRKGREMIRSIILGNIIMLVIFAVFVFFEGVTTFEIVTMVLCMIIFTVIRICIERYKR